MANADWTLELLSLTPQAGRNHDVGSQQEQNGRGGPSMQVFGKPKPNILLKMREVHALMNSQGGFEDAVRVLENFMDTSKAVDGVAVCRVVLSGKSPVETEEGNNICQEISAKLVASLDPTDLGNRVLNLVVKTLQISADPQVLADAGVEDGCAVREDILDAFANIVDRHESNPIGAELAMEGARHLAKCSDVALRSMRNPQFLESLVEAHEFGKSSRNNHNPSLLAEQAKLLLETLHPEVPGPEE